MGRFLRRISSVLVTLALASIIGLSTLAQEVKPPAMKDTAQGFDIRKASFFLPQPLPAGKYSHIMSILYVVVPKDWTLDIINAPMLSYAGKYTLPYGFNVQASLATLFISYRFLLGPFWNYSIDDHFHVGAGWQFAFNYGVLNQFGFRTHLVILEQQPSIVAGYSFRKMAVTVRGEMIWTNALYESQGGHVIPYTNSFVNGYGVTATLEQRLWKSRILSFAVKIADVRYHIIAWPAFPVNQYRYIIPEFQLGLSL